MLSSSTFSALSTFLFAILPFVAAFVGVSGAVFLSFDSVFFPTASAGVFRGSVASCAFPPEPLMGDLVGVAGAALVPGTGATSTAWGILAACLPFFVFAGVSSLTGVTGTTGTAGMIVEDVVRDIGREPGRDPGSEVPSPTRPLGIAGAVKPGGTDGVDRRGCSKNCPVNGVPRGRMGSFSSSLTSASTSRVACSSSAKVPTVHGGQQWFRPITKVMAVNNDGGGTAAVQRRTRIAGNALSTGTSSYKGSSLEHLRHFKGRRIVRKPSLY